MASVTIITALMAEAVPIIDFYRLKKQHKQPGLHFFQAADIDLIVCGLGEQNTQQGMATYLKTIMDDLPRIWLNVGVAGALSDPLGSLVWANYIGDEVISCPESVNNNPNIKVVSVSKPSSNYQPYILFDMEAKFCLQMISNNITKHAESEFYCVKIISDNQLAHQHNIDKKWVMTAIRKQMQPLSVEINKILAQ